MKSEKLLIGILTISFYILSPMVMLAIITPNFLFRGLVKVLKKVIRKDLENTVSPLSNLFGVDKLYSSPTSTLIMGSLYDGIVTRELVCELITEKWLEKQDLNGNLLYPELREYLETWLGYQFWKRDASFNVYNHVKVVKAEDISSQRENLSQLFVRMVNEPFRKLQSPWEILLIPQYEKNTELFKQYQGVVSTFVVFKVHHTLMDGFSMMKLGQRDLGNINMNEGRNSTSCQLKNYSFLLKSIALFRLPYFAAKYFVNERGLNMKDYFNQNVLPEKTKQVEFFAVEQIELNKLKQIKIKYKVSLTSILLAAYAAAIRHFLIKNDLLHENSLPTCMVPVPLPGHPEKLRNHMSFVSINLPIQECNSHRRLTAIHKKLDSARKSLDPLSLYYALKCIGSFPSFAVKIFLRNSPVSLILSNFPGLFIPLTICGHRCTEIFFNGGLLEGNIHMVCSCVGYNDIAQLTVSTDDCYLQSNLDVAEFMQIITKEFDFLAS